jgi:tol-pal system protein YbgF
VNKKFVGSCLLVLSLCGPLLADQKQKKVYELIYEDIQALKKQMLDLSALVQKNSEDIEFIKAELKTLGDTIRRAQADDAGFKTDLKAVPEQYQALARRIEQIGFDIGRILDSLSAERPAVVMPATAEPKIQDKNAKDLPAGKPAEQKPAPAAGNVSPQNMYNMAYNDYLKGNFALAIEGFKMYKDQFADSPLADNALYWIGECYYSQRKYDEAIGIFNELILTYPQGDKIPAAFLKKGMSFAATGKKDEAVSAYRLLISKYPLEEETRIAQQKLKELLEQ